MNGIHFVFSVSINVRLKKLHDKLQNNINIIHAYKHVHTVKTVSKFTLLYRFIVLNLSF